MNKIKTHMVSIVEKDDDGNIIGGIKFWWTEGAHIATYHEWDHNASGPTFSDIMPEPVMNDPEGKMSAIEYTVRTAWLEQTGMEWHKYDTNYC
jgi:hypothetical protein